MYYSYSKLRKWVTHAIRWSSAILFCVSTVSLGHAQEGDRPTWSQYLLRFDVHGEALRLSYTSSCMRNPQCAGEIGGVAFRGVAVPVGNAVGAPISLSYVSSKPDGQRLELQIGGSTVATDIPDWLLLPTAAFAASPYNAAMTLSGGSRQGENRWLQARYHPAVEDNLLGLRLLHVDRLWIDPLGIWNVPTSRSGRPILGNGESAEIDTAAALISAREVLRLKLKFRPNQSYYGVLRDSARTVTFASVNGRLMMTGNPYYYFWYPSGSSVVPLAEMTDSLGKQAALFQSLSPHAFAAAREMMRYSALFRYIRMRNPEAWTRFLQQTSGVAAVPRVKTPTFIRSY